MLVCLLCLVVGLRAVNVVLIVVGWNAALLGCYVYFGVAVFSCSYACCLVFYLGVVIICVCLGWLAGFWCGVLC